MTKVGYVIGNGTSRKGFDLKKLNKCVTVGCNGIYKDYSPTYLVAIDRNMKKSPCDAIEKIINKKSIFKKSRKWKYVTREFEPFKSGSDKGVWWMTVEGEKQIEEEWLNRGFCHNSGMFGALLLSQVQNLDVVYLIGIDFFRPTTGGVNDVYGGSFESDPGLVKVWNHMFEGSPLNRLTGNKDEDGQPELELEYLIETKFIRVGPIEESDKEYYKNEHPLLECIGFDDMPICPQ